MVHGICCYLMVSMNMAAALADHLVCGICSLRIRLGLILESCSLLSSFLQVLGGKSMSIMFVYACALFGGG